MKTFKQLVNEVAEPKAGDEKKFKAKHKIEKHAHPVAGDDQFVAKVKKDKTKNASYEEGQDEAVYEDFSLDDEEYDEQIDEVARSPYTGAKVTGPADLGKEKLHYKKKRTKQRSAELGEEKMSYGDALKKIKKIKKGSEVSFTHHTGKKVTGQYRGLKRMGPYSYAHVETGKEAHRVPVHQIHQVQEDVTIADVGKSLSRAYNTAMNPVRSLRHKAGVAGKNGKKPFPPKNPNPSYHTPKPRPGELNRNQFGLMKNPSKFTRNEEVDLDEGKKGVVLRFDDQIKSRRGAEDEARFYMKKHGGSSFTVFKATNGLWGYKIFEEVELNEIEITKSDYFTHRNGTMTINDLMRKHRATRGQVQGELNLMRDHERHNRPAFATFKEQTAINEKKKISKNYAAMLKSQGKFDPSKYQVDEQFKSGMNKMEDGSSVMISSNDAKMLNDAMKQMDRKNAKQMTDRAQKSKKEFNDVLAFVRKL